MDIVTYALLKKKINESGGGGGDVNFVTFEIDPTTNELMMLYDKELTGSTFTINDKGELEVEIHG